MKIGERVLKVETCSSTNDLAHEQAAQGCEEGTVIVAREQTEGRGTKGRAWFSPRDKGLYLSVILRPPKEDVTLLPLAAGLAVRDALVEATGLEVKLKWPNDLVWERRKMGGILCEASIVGNRLTHVVLGLGLNVNHGREDFPPAFRPRATSMKLALRRETDPEALLPLLWGALDFWYRFLLEGREAQVVEAFKDHSVFSPGDELEVQTDTGTFAARYRGVDIRGRLELEEGGKIRSCLAAEVVTVTRLSEEE